MQKGTFIKSTSPKLWALFVTNAENQGDQAVGVIAVI